MRSLKKLLKHSRMFRYAFAFCIAAIAIALFYRSTNAVRISDIEKLENATSCMVTMGLPQQDYIPAENAAERILKASSNQKLRGMAYLATKDYANAQQAFNDAVKLNPNDTESRKMLAYTHMVLKEYYGVPAHCETLLEQKPNETFCIDALGIAYYATDRNEEALEMGRKAQDMEPSVCHELNLALYRGGVGEIDETRKTLDRLIAGNKTLLLKCWSPIKMDIPDGMIDNYDICFLNKEKQESVCRAFVKEGWYSRDLNDPDAGKEPLPDVAELPAPVFSY